MRLAVHPVANFVVAKAVERLSPTELGDACDELKGSWNRLLGMFCARECVYFLISHPESKRITVVRAFVDRSAKLRSSEENVLEVRFPSPEAGFSPNTLQAVCSAFGLTTSEDKKYVVPCVLFLMSLTVCCILC